jgi:hypothetical protein
LLLGISGHLADTRGVFTVDSQTVTTIVALSGLMIAVTRMSTNRLEERIDKLKAELTAEFDAKLGKVESGLGERIGKVETEVAAVKADVAGVKADVAGVKADVRDLKATVARMDERLYDLATGRRAPLIVAGR